MPITRTMSVIRGRVLSTKVPNNLSKRESQNINCAKTDDGQLLASVSTLSSYQAYDSSNQTNSIYYLSVMKISREVCVLWKDGLYNYVTLSQLSEQYQQSNKNRCPKCEANFVGCILSLGNVSLVPYSRMISYHPSNEIYLSNLIKSNFPPRKSNLNDP